MLQVVCTRRKLNLVREISAPDLFNKWRTYHSRHTIYPLSSVLPTISSSCHPGLARRTAIRRSDAKPSPQGVDDPRAGSTIAPSHAGRGLKGKRSRYGCVSAQGFDSTGGTYSPHHLSYSFHHGRRDHCLVLARRTMICPLDAKPGPRRLDGREHHGGKAETEIKL